MEKKMIKYTIIMPVYNAEKYLEKNLKKIELLNRDDIELLIINDGSTDNSVNIIKKYEGKIKNLVLIDQDNNGVSYSRNLGIKKATGKYITFLDCDDTLEVDIFNELDKVYDDDYDLVRYGFYLVHNIKRKNKIVEEKQKFKDFKNSKESKILLFTTNKMNTVWNQIIKREILINNLIYFDKKHIYAEDLEFNKKLIKYLDKVCLLPNCLYDYYINYNSISNSKDKNKVEKCIKDTLEIHYSSYMECKRNNEIFLEDVFKNVSFEFKGVIRRLFFIKKMKIKDIKLILNNLRNHEDIQTLIKDKKKNNWKSNIFIDYCLYKRANLLTLYIFKIYFNLKMKIKKIIL